MAQAEKHGAGVPNSYKEEAKNGCDVLFHVKIKGRSILVDDIPLHMSLKIFSNIKEFDLEEMKEYVKKNDICAPDPKDLTLKPIIFTAEKSGLDYFMLKIEGLHPKYEEFYNHYKHVGNVYKNFMTHVTIDKKLYDDLKENGVKAEDIEFSKLTLEHGAGNTEHTFEKSENLEKGIKHAVAALGVVGAMASAPKANAPPKPARSPSSVEQPKYDSKKMLNAISSVESSNGKNTNHRPVNGAIHRGESAIGSYGLMPETIRETIHMNPDLKTKYGKGVGLRGDDMRRYVQDNPGLEQTIAQKHLARLEHHFGQNPQTLGFAWNQGISGAYKAQKAKKNFSDNEYVKKISGAYNKGK